MAQKKRRPAQRKRDLFLVAQLYLQRKTQADIAKGLGVSQQQVAYDLKDLQKQWAKERVDLIDQRIAEDLARIDEQERQYWRGWENSQVPRVETTKDPERGIFVKTITSAGDPRFLDGVGKCIEARLTVLGVLAKTKLGTSGGNNPLKLPISSITVTLPQSTGVDAELEFGDGD